MGHWTQGRNGVGCGALRMKPPLAIRAHRFWLWDTGHGATLVLAVGHWTQGHTGAGFETLGVKPRWCWDTGREATLAFVWNPGQVARLVLFARWPLEAAAVFAVTGSRPRPRSTHGALPGPHGWTADWAPGSPPAAQAELGNILLPCLCVLHRKEGRKARSWAGILGSWGGRGVSVPRFEAGSSYDLSVPRCVFL